MNKLSSFIRTYQSLMDTQSLEVEQQTRRYLVPLIESGVTNINLSKVTAHEVFMWVSYQDKRWPVLLVPSFHGMEVKIEGKDANVKSQLAKLITEAFK